MPLPDSYTLKPNAVPAYFDAILDAQPPDRFSLKFLENLGFTSTNDRLFLRILKDLGFVSDDGTPQSRYFDFLDRTRSKQVLADGIRSAFADLFSINTRANELSPDEVKNKLRTLYAGSKTDQVIERIARTFTALCEYADFSSPAKSQQTAVTSTQDKQASVGASEKPPPTDEHSHQPGRIRVSGLQYHINIVLPDTRDQSVYDAIFKSLREHLG